MHHLNAGHHFEKLASEMRASAYPGGSEAQLSQMGLASSFRRPCSCSMVWQHRSAAAAPPSRKSRRRMCARTLAGIFLGIRRLHDSRANWVICKLQEICGDVAPAFNRGQIAGLDRAIFGPAVLELPRKQRSSDSNQCSWVVCRKLAQRIDPLFLPNLEKSAMNRSGNRLRDPFGRPNGLPDCPG
jgi:hypothetical protein